MWRILVLAFGTFLAAPGALAQTCEAPEPVCAAKRAVLRIASFEPVGSAVIVGPGRIVTNRHMLADNTVADVTFADGGTVQGEIVPTSYIGDLVLLDVPGLSETSILPTATAATGEMLYVIGFDIGREAIRVYRPGRLIVAPAETPLARLHHDARSLPGNSGGALVDADGNLVGIVASGGEGRNEAIPVAALSTLAEKSGPAHVAESQVIGRAYAGCAEGLDDFRTMRGQAPSGAIIGITAACLATKNRQMMDLAAQALGMQRQIEPALELLQASYDQDPNAPNTLISLAVTYHLAQRFEDEIPIIRRALGILPGDPQLLRLALQAGIWGGDQSLADEAMQQIEERLPQMAPPARKFYENPPPKPRLAPPG